MPGLEPGPINPQPVSFSGAPVRPTFDVIAALPPAAAERLRMLRQRSLDLRAVIPPFEDVREASMARVEAERAVSRLTDHPQNDGFNLPLDNRSVVEATKHLEKMTADFERLKQLQATRSGAWQAASQALSACETWLRTGRPSGVVLQDFDPVPKLAKGEGVADAIERLRRRGRELKADLHRVRSAPYPSAHALKRLVEIVTRLAREPDVSLLLEHDADIFWPTLRKQAEVVGSEQRSLAFHETTDTIGLLAWLMKDTLTKKLSELVEADRRRCCGFIGEHG